jgi:hypothetical protein
MTSSVSQISRKDNFRKSGKILTHLQLSKGGSLVTILTAQWKLADTHQCSKKCLNTSVDTNHREHRCPDSLANTNSLEHLFVQVFEQQTKGCEQ